MMDPQGMSAQSIMPPYPWLYEQMIDKSLTPGMIRALRTVGVPYEEGYEETANEELDAQAQEIVKNLKDQDDIDAVPEAEIVALIAYLQRLGTDIKAKEVAESK
jgi:cytochrome c oxidase cbb3-type subunit I/II